MGDKTIRAVWLALLGAVVLYVACSQDSMPTAPDTASPESQEETPAVERMPIIRVVRHGHTTPTPAVSPTLSPTLSPTPQRSPTLIEVTDTPRPTPTPTPTATPTTAFTIVRLRAVSWQWDFYGPNASLGPPYPGFNTITLKKGQLYEIHIYNDAPTPSDPNILPHTFSGIPALGLNAGQLLYDHGNELVQQFTPQVPGSYFYNCGETGCSTGDISHQHDQMVGYINVTP